jgi:hypothetical protein
MPCNALEWHHHLAPIIEKIKGLSRLCPCLESDEELGFTQSILMSIIADYALQLHKILTSLIEGAEEGDQT